MADAALPNDIAALIGFACEAVLWGAYTILFGVSILLLFHRRKGASTSLTITIASLVLFGACTAHFGLEFNHFYTTLWATGVDGFANETKPLVGADLLISLCDLFGDFILVYRCWILWGKNYWIVLLPSLTALAGFICIAEVAHFILELSPSSPVPPEAIVPLTTAGYALPLCTNVMATGLIVYKIWRATHFGLGPSGEVLQSTSRVARSAMSIIVESGVLYLAAQLVFVVLVNIKHPAQAIVAVMAVQIYGIAPTLIVIRVGLGLAIETTQAPVSTGPLAWATRSEMLTTGHYTDGTGASGTTATKAENGSAVELKGLESNSHVGKAA